MLISSRGIHRFAVMLLIDTTHGRRWRQIGTSWVVLDLKSGRGDVVSESNPQRHTRPREVWYAFAQAPPWLN